MKDFSIIIFSELIKEDEDRMANKDDSDSNLEENKNLIQNNDVNIEQIEENETELQDQMNIDGPNLILDEMSSEKDNAYDSEDKNSYDGDLLNRVDMLSDNDDENKGYLLFE